jgi:hypothetical protein
MRNINDLVSGKPSNREGLWAMTNKQASVVGHSLSASACQPITGSNSSVHRSTGVTPAEIMFGNAIDLDMGIFLDHIPEGAAPRLLQWMADMRTAQAKFIAIVKHNLNTHNEIYMQTKPINPSE